MVEFVGGLGAVLVMLPIFGIFFGPGHMNAVPFLIAGVFGLVLILCAAMVGS